MPRKHMRCSARKYNKCVAANWKRGVFRHCGATCAWSSDAEVVVTPVSNCLKCSEFVHCRTVARQLAKVEINESGARGRRYLFDF